MFDFFRNFSERVLNDSLIDRNAKSLFMVSGLVFPWFYGGCIRYVIVFLIRLIAFSKLL
jgi:hypothetical protein